MTWKDAIKKEDNDLDAFFGMIGMEGTLDQIMKNISEEFDVKVKIIYDSSSQPVLGFELPIFVRCEMGTTKRPNSTAEFTVKNIGENKSGM